MPVAKLTKFSTERKLTRNIKVNRIHDTGLEAGPEKPWWLIRFCHVP
jgi:hypothetical protein